MHRNPSFHLNYSFIILVKRGCGQGTIYGKNKRLQRGRPVAASYVTETSVYVLASKARLLSLRRTYGTYVCAVAAINAAVSVNRVNSIAGADAGNRTFSFASTTADAFFCDCISHLTHLLMLVTHFCVGENFTTSIITQKKQKGK